MSPRAKPSTGLATLAEELVAQHPGVTAPPQVLDNPATDLASLAAGPPSTERDPFTLLDAQNSEREASLIPLRWQRMSASAFTFYRGSAVLMAHDLGAAPRSIVNVQLCGDAHLSNFGLFASTERRLVFDVNDLDGALPGPFEWDVKRLATSGAVAAADGGVPDPISDALRGPQPRATAVPCGSWPGSPLRKSGTPAWTSMSQPTG